MFIGNNWYTCNLFISEDVLFKALSSMFIV